MISKVRLFDNSLWGGISAVFKMVSSVISVFLLINLLGAEVFGVVTIISTISGAWVIISSGFYIILVRRLIHARNNEENGTDNLIVSGLIFSLTSIFFLLIIFYFFKDNISESLFLGKDMPISLRDFQISFDIAIAGITIRIIIEYISALFEGSGRFSIAAKLQMFSPTIILSVVIAYLIFHIDLSVNQYFVIILVSLLSELLISIFILSKTRPDIFSNKFNIISAIKLLVPMLSESARIQAANIFSLFVDPLNKLFLHNIIGPLAVTSYEVATRIINAMRGVFSAAFRSFMQLSPNLDQAKNKYNILIDYIFIPALILHLIVLVVLTEFICKKYIEISINTIYLLSLVLPTSMAIVVVSPLYSLLIGVGDLRYILSLHIRLAAFNAVGAIIFIPLFGVVGSGIAITIATYYNAHSIYHQVSTQYISLPEFSGLILKRVKLAGILIIMTLGSMIASFFLGNPFSSILLSVILIIFSWIFWQEPLVKKLLYAKVFHKFSI